MGNHNNIDILKTQLMQNRNLTEGEVPESFFHTVPGSI